MVDPSHAHLFSEIAELNRTIVSLKKLVTKLQEAMCWEHESGCSGQFGYRCKCGLHERLLDPDYGMSKHPEAAEMLKRENYRPMSDAEKKAITEKFRRILGYCPGDKDGSGSLP